MVSEYAAATNLIIPTGMIINFDVIVEHVINMISAIKFAEGGAAILAADIINHSIDIVGINILIPLFIRSLREFDMEYAISAEANKAELRSPCAIIIEIAPQIPH